MVSRQNQHDDSRRAGDASASDGGGALSGRSESETTDERLAERMFSGDEEATRQLLERYRRPLYGTLLRLTRNPADAEELYQEAFLRALRAGARFDPKRRFKPWIFAIAVNLARDKAKRAAHRATPELRAADELPETHDGRTEARWILRADLGDALDRLSEPHREVIELRYFEGMDEPEIAAAANIPRGTVKSRLYHAVRKLRDAMSSGDAP